MPHWQYAWRAHLDASPWGHRWNTAPEVVCELHARHWSHLAALEALNTYSDFRLSFDFVLRKKGVFVPFTQSAPGYPTGAARYAAGTFIGPVGEAPRRRL